MKTKPLKEMFFRYGGLLKAGFTEDRAVGDPEFASVRRTVQPGLWQFVGLSFAPNMNRFYIEAAISPAESYPLNLPLNPPGKHLKKGGLRFRANELWTDERSFGGWFIEPPLTEFEYLGLTDSPEDRDFLAMLTEAPGGVEGVFKTHEEAFASAERRIAGWILPFLDDFHR